MNDPRGRTTGEDPFRGVREARLEPLDEPRPGERLGGERSYRLVEELGEGGMGRVFLAERSDGEFRQRVAIKLLRWSLGGDADAARRFRAERQILARLNHPNIGRLLDGGTTPLGQPFLVMEYIEGEPIDDYVSARSLTVAHKLDLFLKVCDAVRIAHQSLVVHRDLKPANILVDGSGEPKLLDFGIAKLLDPELVGDRAETRRGETLLTPRYASPEQITAGAITTASDIYALGVILYELLAGRAPYDVTLTAPMELVRAICETVPAAPSVAVAKRERTQAQRIPRDLDEIVLKALRKEPGERYVSVDDLAEDLRRFLEGRPVAARRGGRTYRLARFARRHRLALAVAAIFLATVAGFILSLSRQLAETSRQRDEAARQRDVAGAATDFLVKIFGAADPGEARGEQVSARTLLDRGAARVDRELAGQPFVHATLLHQLGVVYLNLGALERSDDLLRRALAARETLLPATSREIIETRYRLGWSRAQAGDRIEGERLLRQALADLERAGFKDPTTEVMILNGLGAVLVYQARYDEAKPFLERALSLRGAAGLAPDTPFQGTLNNLGLLHLNLEQWPEAIPYFEEALRLELATHGERHPNEALLRSNLSWCLAGAGRFEEAEREARRASELSRSVLGELHVSTLYADYRLGWALQHLGRFEEAEVAQRDTLAKRLEHRASSPYFEVLMSQHTLARLLRWRGRLSEAIPLYGVAIERGRRELGDPLLPDILRAEAELADTLLDAGRNREALELVERVWRDLAGRPGLAAAEIAAVSARALAADDARRGEAGPRAREALAQLDALEAAAPPTSDSRLVRHHTLATLAALAESSGDRAAAEKLWREAAAIEPVFAPGEPRRGEAARALARLGNR